MLKRIYVLIGVGISLFLVWFAVSNYRASRPIAEENLRGLALSLASAIESIAVRDPSLQSLVDFHPPDLAFFALISEDGIYRFHTNADLIGTPVESGTFAQVLKGKTTVESRVVLGTGEKAFEFYGPLYLPGETLALRLTLHTYRADTVTRRAEYNMLIIFSLLGVGWGLLAILYKYSLREERHQLEMAHRERLAQMGEMGAMLAHEIRNPLAGIKGYAQVIAKKPQDDRNAGFAQRIAVEVLRLENLVNDLLSYARTDVLPLSAVNVSELLHYTVALVRNEAEQKDVAISTECAEGLQVRGNRDRLGQVLLNLCKNALQSMPEGGSLQIKAGTFDTHVILAVSDTGHGIACDDLERVFEPFFTTKARGTGLGLALCKKIVEEHGGTIRVESEMGKGTSIIIDLPGVGRDK